MQTVSDFFGCHVFSESVMKQKLPKEVFKDVYAAIHEGKRLDLAAANVVPCEPGKALPSRLFERIIRAQRANVKPHAEKTGICFSYCSVQPEKWIDRNRTAA